MKVLQINNVYDFGSTGKIVADIHRALQAKGWESSVYYGRRYKTADSGVHKICSEFYGKAQNGLYQITGVKYGGCRLSTDRLLAAVEREKPDIVHLHCLNGHFVNIYRLVEYLKIKRIPTVLTLHAEFMYTGGCSHSVDCDQWRDKSGCGSSPCPLYGKELKSKTGDKSAVMWKKMYEAFRGFDRLAVVSVSPWLMERARQSAILCDKRHLTVFNGLDTTVFCPRSEQALSALRRDLGYKPEDKIVFHASPSFDDDPENIKGGYYVLEAAKRLKNVSFLVAGRYDPTVQVPANVRLLGNLTDKDYLASLYSLADVTLLTSKRETFSMICAESLCCGTPVVGFKAGAPEMISLPDYSDFCEYGDINALEKMIAEWICKEKSSDICLKAAKAYNKEKMSDSYIDIYTNFLESSDWDRGKHVKQDVVCQ